MKTLAGTLLAALVLVCAGCKVSHPHHRRHHAQRVKVVHKALPPKVIRKARPQKVVHRPSAKPLPPKKVAPKPHPPKGKPRPPKGKPLPPPRYH